MIKRSPSSLVIGCIVANEFCERFCFYGFRTLLYVFIRQSFELTEGSSIRIVHFFNFSCYFFTFIGGLLSDTYLGRFKTILYLSLVYLIGTIITTISSVKLNLLLLWCGLVLISIGTGGIKPCVSTFGGDQYDPQDVGKIRSFFNMFYFAINAGSLLSIFVSPIIAGWYCYNNKSCYPLAFGLPAILLCISLILFLAGKNRYIRKEPNSKFIRQIIETLIIFIFSKKSQTDRSFEMFFFDGINLDRQEIIRHDKHDKFFRKITYKFGFSFVEDLKRALEILNMFMLVPIFWMLYDQQSTTWVEQATNMKTDINLFFFKFKLIPSQMQAFNGILILLFIPLFTKIVYPFIHKLGYEFNSLTKMSWGMVLASGSFFSAALIEKNIENDLHILWQIPQYILLTAGEILLSMTGIEFVYSQSPTNVKGLILSGWLLTVAIGNLYVIIFASIDIFRWLGVENINMWNCLLYGCIGLISSSYFYRHSQSFKFKREN